MNKRETLEAAIKAVADRGLNYGKPEDNFNRIAARWQVHILNRYNIKLPLDAGDVAMMMADMKLARLENQPDHNDSWIDLAGYAACGADLFNKPETKQEQEDSGIPIKPQPNTWDKPASEIDPLRSPATGKAPYNFGS